MQNAKKQNNGFTLVELLVVISIIAILLAVLIPVLGMVRGQAKKVICTSNLKQLGIAFDMYLREYNGNVFPLSQMGEDDTGQLGYMWYYGFEPGSGFGMPEGKRPLYRKYAKLYPYIKQYDSVEICPAFPYGDKKYKPKYNTKWMTYGINSRLSIDLRDPGKEVVNFDKYVGKASDVLVFADSAQVNTFQDPASPSNPMFEEWHYIETSGSFVHFRHNLKANILFGDGHVSDAKADKESLGRWPAFQIGSFSNEIRF
jgi:prepilin-type N-terminal cleavage/methylation domain-containing protein/prepilin-type processing-associated H-X9-DG protein